MNGLFGVPQNMNPVPQQPMHPDVAAAMGNQPTSAYPQQPGMGNGGMPQAAPVDPNAMSPEQQALNDWMAQQEKAKQPAPKYTVGDPNLDKYINMFLPQGD